MYTHVIVCVNICLCLQHAKKKTATYAAMPFDCSTQSHFQVHQEVPALSATTLTPLTPSTSRHIAAKMSRGSGNCLPCHPVFHTSWQLDSEPIKKASEELQCRLRHVAEFTPTFQDREPQGCETVKPQRWPCRQHWDHHPSQKKKASTDSNFWNFHAGSLVENFPNLMIQCNFNIHRCFVAFQRAQGLFKGADVAQDGLRKDLAPNGAGNEGAGSQLGAPILMLSSSTRFITFSGKVVGVFFSGYLGAMVE